MADAAAARHGTKVRLLALLFAAGAVLALFTIVARAQDWPNHAIKIIVPYGPGGITDMITRVVADHLSKTFGQPFVLENRDGAGGAIGTEFAVRAPKDGYWIYIAGGSPLTVVAQMQKVAYDLFKDLSPVGMIAKNPMAFTVHPDLGRCASSSITSRRVLSRRDQLFGRRYRLIEPPCAGIAGRARRSRHARCALPEYAARSFGAAHGHGANVLWKHYGRDRADPKREVSPAGSVRRETQRGVSRRSHGCRDATRLHHDRLARRFRACRHSEARGQSVVGRDRGPRERSGIRKILGNLGIDAVGGSPDELAQALQSEIALYKSALTAAGILRQDVAR